MKIALTGGTGFLGRYLLRDLAEAGHTLRAWARPTSDRTGLGNLSVEWVTGDLASPQGNPEFVAGCDAVVHSALYRPGAGFRGAEGDVATFLEMNVLGTIRLVEAARAAGVDRFVFISTCAVHEVIREDRPLDEAHPLWPLTHYGAHKAAIEKFVHSYGLGQGYPICSLRPTGIYGLAHPASASKWYDLVQRIARGENVTVSRGGKEVHAADVARATRLLLEAEPDAIGGQAFNCYDQYISEYTVAHLARDLSGSDADITGEQKAPKHQIETGRLQALGMRFGGTPRLQDTIRELLAN